jgi:hypothetical protein
MRILIFATTLLSISLVKAEDIKCPEESMLVDFVVSFSHERNQVCQKAVGQQYVKHGPEIIYFPNGNIKSKNFYQDGVLTAEPVVKKDINKEQQSETSKEIEQVIDIFADNLFLGLLHKKRLDLIDGSGLCHESAMARMNFVLNSVPYTNKIIFKRQCILEGDFRNEFDKKLTANLKLNNLFGYDQLVFSYLQSKNKKDDVISISIEILDGEFKSPSKKPFKFRGQVLLKINPQQVVNSFGKNGIDIELASIVVTEYDGKPYSLHRDLLQN